MKQTYKSRKVSLRQTHDLEVVLQSGDPQQRSSQCPCTHHESRQHLWSTFQLYVWNFLQQKELQDQHSLLDFHSVLFPGPMRALWLDWDKNAPKITFTRDPFEIEQVMEVIFDWVGRPWKLIATCESFLPLARATCSWPWVQRIFSRLRSCSRGTSSMVLANSMTSTNQSYSLCIIHTYTTKHFPIFRASSYRILEII